MPIAFRVTGAHLFDGCETTESASLNDGGAEQTASRVRRAPAFWSQKLSAGASVVRSRFRLIRPDFEPPMLGGEAPNAGLTGRN